MPRRDFLMGAKVYNPDKHEIAGWYISEKIDGARCFWDGGLTRGMPTTSIPWANVLHPKTGQPKTNIKPLSSGLWSRYANPITAPNWFLNDLPCIPLDGDLWAGRGNFQQCMSAIKKNKPIDKEWKQIQYGIFGCPNFWEIMQSGEIKDKNFIKTMDQDDIKRWIKNCAPSVLQEFTFLQGKPIFTAELANLNDWVDHSSEVYFLIQHTRLPRDEKAAKEFVASTKETIISGGGEGVFLRDPNSIWQPKKVWSCLKCKGALDDEGIVTGFTSGRETDKGSKLLGMIGALVLEYDGQRLELSGLTNEEREFHDTNETAWAKNHPGEDMPDMFQGKMFKLGDKVTFTYRELSDKGIPKDARYLRKRPTT